MRRIEILGAALVAMALAACGGGGGGGTTTTPGFPQPAGTVAVNFTVDDTANKVFTAGQLEWKGAMVYNSTTRKITGPDATWGGPWAPLYDDGPWNVDPPGHEPAGSVAGDHKWGVTVFATPPATASFTIEYGLNDALYQTNYGNGWIWPPGDNGSFVVNAGATAAINAPGLVLPAFGTTDLQLTLDTNNLGPGTWDPSVVKVKGSAWAWGNITLADDGTKGDATAGDGIYTLELSQYVGVGKPFSHTGLLKSGDKPEFIWVLGTGIGVEYKTPGNVAELTGVAAGTKAAGAGSFTPQTVAIAANFNTYITVP